MIILGDKNNMNEPKNNLIKYLTGSSSEVLTGGYIAFADGTASITACTKSIMKEGARPRAGTLA